MKYALFIIILCLCSISCFSLSVSQTNFNPVVYEGVSVSYEIQLMHNSTEYNLSIIPLNDSKFNNYIYFYIDGEWKNSVLNYYRVSEDNIDFLKIKIEMPTTITEFNKTILLYRLSVDNETKTLKFNIEYKKSDSQKLIEEVFFTDLLKSKQKICTNKDEIDNIFIDQSECDNYYEKEVVYLKSWQFFIILIVLIIIIYFIRKQFK